MADPAPLGLAGFAMTTFALSIGNTNVWGAGGKAALALALAYGGIVQLLAGMWEFRRGNTFGALAFSSYGAFWIAYYVLVTSVLPGIKNPDDASVAVGVFLLGWTVFTAYMTVASLRVSGSVALVFVLLTATFVLLTIAAFHDSTSLTKAGGWVGVATAVAAWYASFAGVVNETFKKTVLPTLPLAPRALPPATTTTSTPARP
ncbi:MAG: acetate uptake transporter [Acidimicrobiales bacterium]